MYILLFFLSNSVRYASDAKKAYNRSCIRNAQPVSNVSKHFYSLVNGCCWCAASFLPSKRKKEKKMRRERKSNELLWPHVNHVWGHQKFISLPFPSVMATKKIRPCTVLSTKRTKILDFIDTSFGSEKRNQYEWFCFQTLPFIFAGNNGCL